MAVLGPDLSARCGHQPPADTGQPVGRTQQAAQAFVVPCLSQMGQPVPHHNLPAAPETGLVKDAAHGLIQLLQRAGGQVDEAILHQPVLPEAHIQAMPARVRSGDGLAR